MDTIALDQWSHIKAVVKDDSAVFYVDQREVLRVAGLQHGPSARGNVGLYVGIGTDGYFRNLCITCED